MQEMRSDAEIIALYKDGNEEIFKELVEKYTGAIFNFSARFIGKTEAVDITQDIFIKVWKNLKKFNPEKASLKTWIFTIAKNTITDFLRKSGSASGGKKSITFSDMENDKDEISFSETITDETLLPDEAMQKLQDIELLNKTLDKLDVNYKTVLILHYQEDMTFDEIGKILDKPLNTVKSYHHRAILKLRSML